MEEELWKTGKWKQMELAEEESRRVGKRRQMESTEEELEWWVWVEKRLERIEGLLEGLGLQITVFQEALSILVGKIPNEDLYRKRGRKKKEKMMTWRSKIIINYLYKVLFLEIGVLVCPPLNPYGLHWTPLDSS